MRYTFTLVRMSKIKKTVTNAGVYFSFFSVAVIKNKHPNQKLHRGGQGLSVL